jgi:hypothetical protein
MEGIMQATAIIFSLIFSVSIFAHKAEAKEVQVIDIRKNLQLSSTEPVFTDYYLNAGNDLGIKPGTTFVLYRRVNVIDRLGSNQGRALSLPVGKIKIIYVSKDLSVARVEKLEENKSTPILEHRGVMLGDLINVGSAEMSNEDPKEAYYGPQGLDVSFESSPIVTPTLPSKIESRMPASTTTEVLKARSSNSNVETIKSNNNPSQKQELPLIR